MPNRAQIEAQFLQLREQAGDLLRRQKAFGNRGVPQHMDVEYREIMKNWADLKAAKDSLDRYEAHPVFGSDSALEGPQLNTPNAPKALGRQFKAFDIPEMEMNGLYDAADRRQNYQTKTAVSVSEHIPPQLQAGIVDTPWEGRLFDVLPVTPIDTPSYRYVKHGAATGTPTMVAEAAAKPEISHTFTHVDVTAQKFAAWTSISTESMDDYPTVASWLQSDLVARINSVLNDELLNQTGTANHLDGLLHQAGLTHARATDTSETSLDALEASISALRVGSELCSPDFLVIHPTTWSVIRRLKNTQGEYLFNKADATDAALNRVWGIPVLPTTEIAAGTGLFVNQKFGSILLRKAMSVFADSYSASTNNVTKYIAELRLALAVERPNALLKVTGLGTDATDTAP